MRTQIDIENLLVWAFRDQSVEASPGADADAVTVYWAVQALPVSHANIVIRHAGAGSRPVWQAATGRMVSLDRVRLSRRRHVEWVRSLVVLQRTLEGTLSRFRVTGPAAEEEPSGAGPRLAAGREQCADGRRGPGQ